MSTSGTWYCPECWAPQPGPHYLGCHGIIGPHPPPTQVDANERIASALERIADALEERK